MPLELEISVGGLARRLAFSEDSDLDALAADFVEEHGLQGGEGCSSSTCVATMLATAMRQHLGTCAGSASVDGSPCINRVAVAGSVYRAQGAAEVDRQLALLAARPKLLPRETRTVRAPCAPPYCSIDCATTDAAHEARFAADFIATDEELSALWARDPPARSCPGGPIYPIFIGIPSEDFVDCVPRKYFGFQGGADGNYRFSAGEEAEYKRGYRESYFGVTQRKAGWDCLRHYEIVASGAIPYFVNTRLDECPNGTMAHWPKRLLARLAEHPAILRPGELLDARRLDASGDYAAAAAGLLHYARNRLSAEALADYVSRASGHPAAKSALLISAHPDPDYLRDMLLIGLRRRLGSGLVDFVRPPHLYAPEPGQDPAPHNYSKGATLYGYGFSYAYRLRDDAAGTPVDRADLDARIRRREFDFVVYASVHRGMPFWSAVLKAYPPSDIVFVDGEDAHGWSPWSVHLRNRGHYFMRELPDGCPPWSPHDETDVLSPDSFHGPFF